MLPPDLLNELLSLVDDSSTFYALALASKCTMRFAENQNVNAKRRYSIRRDRLVNGLPESSYLLPNNMLHGPILRTAIYKGVIWYTAVMGLIHGIFSEWRKRVGNRTGMWTYNHGFLDGLYMYQDEDGTMRRGIHHIMNRICPASEFIGSGFE